MRQLRMSGSMSGDRKRSQVSPGWGGGTKAPPTTCREATATAPVVDSTCALIRRTVLPGGNPGRQTLAPAGSTRGGSGGDEWPEAPREKAP